MSFQFFSCTHSNWKLLHKVQQHEIYHLHLWVELNSFTSHLESQLIRCKCLWFCVSACAGHISLHCVAHLTCLVQLDHVYIKTRNLNTTIQQVLSTPEGEFEIHLSSHSLRKENDCIADVLAQQRETYRILNTPRYKISRPL